MVQEFITTYGIETVIIAVLINILTGLLKIPIKNWIEKRQGGSKFTRYIVFLPLIFGFILSAIYTYFFKDKIFCDEFISLWLTATSLSLAIYAMLEKFFPSKKKIMQENELKENLEIIDKIKNSDNFTTQQIQETIIELAEKILGGNNNAEPKEK